MTDWQEIEDEQEGLLHAACYKSVELTATWYGREIQGGQVSQRPLVTMTTHDVQVEQQYVSD